MHFIFSTSERQQTTLFGETPFFSPRKVKDTPGNGLSERLTYEINRSRFAFLSFFFFFVLQVLCCLQFS